MFKYRAGAYFMAWHFWDRGSLARDRRITLLVLSHIAGKALCIDCSLQLQWSISVSICYFSRLSGLTEAGNY